MNRLWKISAGVASLTAGVVLCVNIFNSVAVAFNRGLMAFSFVFIWTAGWGALARRVAGVPAGAKGKTASRRVEKSGGGPKIIDAAKTPIDAASLQDLLK